MGWAQSDVWVWELGVEGRAVDGSLGDRDSPEFVTENLGK